MIELSSRFKHELAKAFVQAILKQAGYRVINSGMEHVIREVAPLSFAEYKSLDLPKVLRVLPDFVVLDKALARRSLVDANYRSMITEWFLKRLDAKVRVIGEMSLVLFNGRTTTPGVDRDLGGVVRCCRLRLADDGTMAELLNSSRKPEFEKLDQVRPDELWAKMLPLEKVFDNLDGFDPRLEAAVETAARAFAA